MDIYSREKRSEIMSKVRSQSTGPEIIVRKYLHSLGFRFRLHSKKLPGTPDIVLRKYQSVIFVHGCFWHHHKGCRRSKMPSSNMEFWDTKISTNIRRDKRNTSKLKQLGWRVLIIWECETKNEALAVKLPRFFSKVEGKEKDS